MKGAGEARPRLLQEEMKGAGEARPHLLQEEMLEIQTHTN
jgi:hypothetical protein